MKSFGNLILMTLICIVIFWIFMALRPAKASPLYKWQCGEHTVTIRWVLPWQTHDGESSYAYIQFEPRWPSDDIHFKWDRNNPWAKEVKNDNEGWAVFTGGKAFLNGKRCKDYVPEKTKSGE